jgi:hypothetical protein
MIQEIDAASDTFKLNVKLSCPARTILFTDAKFHGPLGAAGVRAVVHNALSTTAAWPPPNVDGITVVPLYFYCDLHLRIDMAAGTYDNTLMGSSLASLKDSVSVAFTSTGVVTISNPTITGFPKVGIHGTAGRKIRTNVSASTTIITIRDDADAVVNDTIHVLIPNMALPHADIPTTAELAFMMIAADYAVW